MKPGFAIQLDNWFPESGVIRTRRGSRVHAETAAGTIIGTLVPQTAAGDTRLFAIAAGGIYNVGAPDSADPSANVPRLATTTAITSERWRWANLNGHIILVNGQDFPIRIQPDGTPAAHGFTASSGHNLEPRRLSHVVSHQNRLFFAERDSARVWYGGPNAIAGELASVNLGLVDGRGGNVAAMGSISVDAGEGVDDLLAIITTTGTVYVYAGTDPSSAANWTLKGVFHIGPPVGPTPILQLGGDLIVITTDGFMPLLQHIRGTRAQSQYAISDPIGATVRDAIAAYSTEHGWQSVLHAKASWILFNAPRRGGEAIQFVMNSQTGAWCRFLGMPAECWTVWNDRIFYGRAAGEVWEADVGGRDGENPIQAYARSAFNHLGSPYSKQSRRLRAHVESPTTEPVSVGLSADYDLTPPPPVSTRLAPDGGLWGEAFWGSANWGVGVARHRAWKKVSAGGVAFSVTLAADLRTSRATYFGAELLYDQTRGAAN